MVDRLIFFFLNNLFYYFTIFNLCKIVHFFSTYSIIVILFLKLCSLIFFGIRLCFDIIVPDDDFWPKPVVNI